MKTNQMAELEQKIPTFSNPANQMSGKKQENLNLFVVMLATTWSQAQAVGNFRVRHYCVTLDFTFTTARSSLD